MRNPGYNPARSALRAGFLCAFCVLDNLVDFDEESMGAKTTDYFKCLIHTLITKSTPINSINLTT